MAAIYVPSGKAREYSPYALNVYLTCTHKCKYCYAPNLRRQTAEKYSAKPYPRNHIVENLKSDLSRFAPRDQVLLSFVGDVYCESMDDNRATHDVLETLLDYKVPVAILTKGGRRCLKDLELFKQFGKHIQIGTTLTFDNDKDSAEWESGAAPPDERIEVLKELHDNGIRTFVSFEPVIIPSQSLSLMQKVLNIVDIYKVGKINNYNGMDKTINWELFLQQAVDLLRTNDKEFYIKRDLRQAAPSIKLCKDECTPDVHNVR